MADPQRNRLFVGNLSWSTTDASLREAFCGGVGDQAAVVEAKVILDRYTGRSRGFGFVTLDTEETAVTARNVMNGVEIDGRAVRVDIASSTRN